MIAGLERFRAALAARRRLRPWRLAPGRAVVSFSFDDSPASSARVGAPLLERHGAHGTWYICGALVGGTFEGRVQCSESDVLALHGAGHEIGCHTHSHIDCLRQPSARIAADLEANARWIAERTGAAPRNFSYPYGRYGLRAQAVAGRRFATARGVRPGINRGLVDLSGLRAISLYSRSFDPAHWRALYDDLVAGGGWMIVYSHGVDREPGPWECTAGQLEQVVRMARDAGAELLSVREAVAAFGIATP